MSVLIERNGESRAATPPEVEEWLRQGNVADVPQLIADNSTAFGDLISVGFSYAYGANEQGVFVDALRRYTGAVDNSRAQVKLFRQIFGENDSSLDIKLDRWTSQLTADERATYDAIQKVLTSGELVWETLARLNALIAADGGRRTYDQWHEAMVGELLPDGFSADRAPLTQILSAKEFLARTAGSRRLPLDPGADEKFFMTFPADRMPPIKHGAFSHTIQWLIVKWKLDQAALRGQTLGTVFERTASVLAKPGDKGHHQSLWSTLVDLPATFGIRYDATMPEGITYLSYRLFPQIATLENQIEEQYLKDLANNNKKAFPFEFQPRRNL